MPDELYTITEAAAVLKISRQTLYSWLAREPELAKHLEEYHTLSRRQLDVLVTKQRKRLPRPTRHVLDSALTARIESLSTSIDALNVRLEALEALDLESRITTMEARFEALVRSRMPNNTIVESLPVTRPPDPPRRVPAPPQRVTKAKASLSSLPPGSVIITPFAKSLGINSRTARWQAENKRIEAERVGREWWLTPEQQEAARLYWRK